MTSSRTKPILRVGDYVQFTNVRIKAEPLASRDWASRQTGFITHIERNTGYGRMQRAHQERHPTISEPLENFEFAPRDADASHPLDHSLPAEKLKKMPRYNVER